MYAAARYARRFRALTWKSGYVQFGVHTLNAKCLHGADSACAELGAGISPKLPTSRGYDSRIIDVSKISVSHPASHFHTEQPRTRPGNGGRSRLASHRRT